MNTTNSLPPLKEGFYTRPATLDDLPEMVRVLNDYWTPLVSVDKFSIDEFEVMASTPGYDLGNSVQVVFAPDGKMVACVLVRDVSSPPVHPSALGAVENEYEGLGIGSYLLSWAERRARQAIQRVPEGARVTLYMSASLDHPPTVRLFEAYGMQAARYFWLMVIELDKKPPDPVWPGGISVTTYQDHPDLVALYRATDEAFQDHWGYVKRDEDESLQRWRHFMENDKQFDPSLYFMVMDGEEIAGVALCAPEIGGDQDMGLVEQLAVHRAWRKRGFGLALLHHAFNVFYERGKKRVGLGVDADSLTGATRLYEKAGMHVHKQVVNYELELRPGEEIGTQDLEEVG